MKTFDYSQKVLFQHCDPAGIVFYPRYFEMINATIEAWFDQDIGIDFKALHVDRKLGVPTAKIETTFLKPSYLGDDLMFSLSPVRIGSSSMALKITIWCADELRAEVKSTLVFVDMKTHRPTPWIDEIKDCAINYIENLADKNDDA